MKKTEAFETTKEEIEKRLFGFSVDMLKMEYLENCLKNHLLSEARRFVHFKLAELYEKKLMFGEAVKHMEFVADLSLTFKDKKDSYMKKIDLLIKNSMLLEAEDSFKKALTCANNPKEKQELKDILKSFYLKRAEKLENSGKSNSAIKFYEKLFSSEPNNLDIINKLAVLYNRVGKIREGIRMENLARSL